MKRIKIIGNKEVKLDKLYKIIGDHLNDGWEIKGFAYDEDMEKILLQKTMKKPPIEAYH